MQDETPNDPSRRDFVALSAAVGLAAATTTVHAADASGVEENVSIKTADGTCDAAFYHPATGSHPGVIVWTDIFGLRPAFREMGRRLAAEGYAVLVPNPFYRTQKAPVFDNIASFNFQSETDRAKLPPLTGPLNAPGAAERDAKAFVAFLDTQKSVNKAKKIGTQGYCMGGPLVMKTAAAVPGRIGAGATFHGGGLVSDKPESPHLMIPAMKSKMYIAVASNDDEKQPDAKDTLRKAFAAANVPAEVEVFTGALHGWCVPDMPAQAGKAIYNKPDAERAWGKLLALYKSALA
jgi:carboxymethylenebutenolidase